MAGKHHHHIPHVHVRDMLSPREFEKQQPIINELVSRFERLQNKRESFKKAVGRPALPSTLARQRDLDTKRTLGEVAIPKPPTPTSSSATLKLQKAKQSLSSTLKIDKPTASAPKQSASPPSSPTATAEPAVTVKRKKTKPFLTMESALADDKLRGHFREFVEAAYAGENLDFYEACEKFSTLAGEKERAACAKKIVDDYVRDIAPNQVNLPAGLASKLSAAVDAGNKEDVDKCLARARVEILDLMQMNFFDKFLSVVGQPAYVSDDSDGEEEKDSDEEKEKKNFFKQWLKRTHPKTGDVYYENPETGVTMWDMPKPIMLNGVPPPLEPPPYF